ncbi:hypothetical protein Bbelb_066290 [Branchiostoma belcheri]|nr:hypothetical protein Bbelb_066290 [Branchiostoma belcheri]
MVRLSPVPSTKILQFGPKECPGQFVICITHDTGQEFAPRTIPQQLAPVPASEKFFQGHGKAVTLVGVIKARTQVRLYVLQQMYRPSLCFHGEANRYKQVYKSRLRAPPLSPPVHVYTPSLLATKTPQGHADTPSTRHLVRRDKD